MENNKNIKTVTIEKWICNKNNFYWIIDSDGNGIDGFSKKYQAIDAIKRWGMIRNDKTIKIKK
jgi:hypothetical protein